MALHLNTRLQFLHVYLMTSLLLFFQENMFFQLPYIEIFWRICVKLGWLNFGALGIGALLHWYFILAATSIKRQHAV